jgi:hypothetical protein
MKQVTISLYSFSELSKEAKERAILEHKKFLESIRTKDDPPKFSRAYVIEDIEIHEYIFFADGELASCTTYVNGPKKDITEFKFHGQIIDITN